MYSITIAPMSVNKAWQGKRFKTTDYKVYEREVSLLLPRAVEVPDGALEVYYEFGMSNIMSDWDNPIKPFQDIIQAKYGFNDRWIVDAHVRKVKVDKGKEYIKFNIKSADQ